MTTNGVASKLDEEFAELLLRIERGEERFNKHERIRIQQWVRKLAAIQCNELWKRNRNSYARLLVACLESSHVIEPFSRMPPQGSLPNLKEHEIKQQQELIAREVPIAQQPERRREQKFRSTQKHYRSGANLSSKKKTDPPSHHVRMFMDALGDGIHSSNLRVSRYRTRIAQLEKQAQEGRRLLLQTEQFLRKHNTRFEEDRRPGAKREYQQLVQAIHQHNSHQQSDLNDETEVRVFHSEDEIQNLKFGLS